MSFANPSSIVKTTSASDEPPALLIFAKAPVAGYCKTRLASALGHVRATGIYRAMLEHAVAHTCDRHAGRVRLVCSPDTRHPFFHRLRRDYGVALQRQCRGDLGRRMHRALSAALCERSAAILIGSDQPVLDDAWLLQASQTLGSRGTAWLAPTVDGGYWAIGLTTSDARVFRGPRWSGPRVCRHTISRMSSAGFSVSKHALRNDIDNGRDWMNLEPRLRSSLIRIATMPGIRACRRATKKAVCSERDLTLTESSDQS